jgi:hypothetical protein
MSKPVIFAAFGTAGSLTSENCVEETPPGPLNRKLLKLAVVRFGLPSKLNSRESAAPVFANTLGESDNLTRTLPTPIPLLAVPSIAVTVPNGPVGLPLPEKFEFEPSVKIKSAFAGTANPSSATTAAAPVNKYFISRVRQKGFCTPRVREGGVV